MSRLVGILALLTLAGCGAHRPAGPRLDPELSRDSSLARVAFDNGATARAAGLYTQALKRATAMDDAVQIANAAYNLALCRIMQGLLDQADATLADAGPALRRSSENPADVLLLLATIAQRQGRYDQAMSLTRQVLSVSSDESHRFQAELLQGTIALKQNDPAQAKTVLAEADKHRTRTTSAALLAAREQLAADILLRENNPAEAGAAFDRAADLFRAATHYRDMALSLRRAGEAYQQAGDLLCAEDRLARAQRSLAAQSPP